MPKRVIDGDGVWRSDKLARVPEWIRPEFANLIPLALANGAFEADPRRVWAAVYSFNRPDITPEKAEQILDAFCAHGMLFRWTEPDGKYWGYWVGIDKPGRLPGKSRRGRNEAIGATPPAAQLAKYVMDSNGIHKFPNGNEKLLGFGSGSGIGSGSGQEPSAPAVAGVLVEDLPEVRAQKPTRAEMDADFEEWYSRHYPKRRDREAARKAYHRVRARMAKDRPETDWRAELNARADAYAREVRGRDDDKIKYPATWLNAGSYLDEAQPAMRAEARVGIHTPPMADEKWSPPAPSKAMLTRELAELDERIVDCEKRGFNAEAKHGRDERARLVLQLSELTLKDGPDAADYCADEARAAS